MSKTKYCVTVVRTGCVFIEAASPEEAMDIADHQRTGDISWSDDWSPTDAEVDDGYLGELSPKGHLTESHRPTVKRSLIL